jgi:predicted Rossmann-fold nucleotide-binding protein
MRVLVCGGRDFCDYLLLRKVLSSLNPAPTLIMHGGARGADRLADLWASAKGIERLVYHADWDNLGRAAGHIRNAQMLSDGKPHLVVAFPGGPGTRSMVEKALKANVKVLQIP